MHKVGVISDTHGLLRPEALAALAGCDVIIHAGDIGPRSLLEQLNEIAPVTAVRGNVDTDAWAQVLPALATVETGGVRIGIIHDLAALGAPPQRSGFRVLVSGHSHKARVEERDGVLYVNPGSAGPRRFRLPVTLARLLIDGDSVRAELITL
jgi:putative phosphoesterase